MRNSKNQHLKSASIDTPLGPMIAIADNTALYLLEFIERIHLENEITRLQKKMNAVIVSGETKITRQITAEIKKYFAGKLAAFKTPIILSGSLFQKKVWKALLTIPPGSITSYLNIAKKIKKPTAFRAVANAIGANQLAIIVPCHRVINSSGKLGGYAAGISRKEWLISHEGN